MAKFANLLGMAGFTSVCSLEHENQLVRACPLDLAIPSDGRLVYLIVAPSCQATYFFNLGCVQNGSVTRSCDNQGVWTGSDPECVGAFGCYTTTAS